MKVRHLISLIFVLSLSALTVSAILFSSMHFLLLGSIICLFIFVFSGDFRSEIEDPLTYTSHSLEESIEKSIQLIGKADKEIIAVSGRIGAEFWNNEKILKALEAAITKDVKVKIIFEADEPDNNSTKILEWWKEGKIELKKSCKKVGYHFMVIDGKHVKLEPRRFHYNKKIIPRIIMRTMNLIGAGSFQEIDSEINFIKLDAPYLANKRTKLFNKFWERYSVPFEEY